MSELINFTKERLTKIAIPTTGIQVYRDSKERGLILIVSYGGSKVFYLYKAIQGTSRKIKLGEFPYLSVDEARNKVIELKTQIIRGLNPMSRSMAKKSAFEISFSFKQLFDRYIEEYAKHNVVTWKTLVLQMNRQAKSLYSKELSSLNSEDIRTIFNELTSNISKTTANSFLTLTRAVLNKAVKWNLIISNPALSIDKNPTNEPRTRYITEEEMPKFLAAIKEEKNIIMADFFLTALLTGCRRSNVASMRWEDISFAAKVWRIERTKNGKPQEVYLTPEVIEILQRRKQQNIDDRRFVFPSKLSQNGYLSDYTYVWKKLCKRANVTSLNFHDLRRTYGTWMRRASGADRATIGKVLNHKHQESTAIYDIIESDLIQKARCDTARAISAFGNDAFSNQISSGSTDLIQKLHTSINNNTNIIGKILSQTSVHKQVNSHSVAHLIKLQEMCKEILQLTSLKSRFKL